MSVHGDIVSLLRIKHLREQRKAATLHEARTAERRATRARQEHEHMLAVHEAERPDKEQAAYRRLAAGPVSTQKLQAEVAQLSGLAAYSAVLRQQAGQAAQQEAACIAASHAAQIAQSAALRESTAADLLHTRLAAERYHADERQSEAQLEELAGRPRLRRS